MLKLCKELLLSEDMPALVQLQDTLLVNTLDRHDLVGKLVFTQVDCAERALSYLIDDLKFIDGSLLLRLHLLLRLLLHTCLGRFLKCHLVREVVFNCNALFNH